MADQQPTDQRSRFDDKNKPGAPGSPGGAASPSKDAERAPKPGQRPDSTGQPSRGMDQKPSRQGADSAESGRDRESGDAQQGNMPVKGSKSDEPRRDSAE